MLRRTPVPHAPKSPAPEHCRASLKTSGPECRNDGHPALSTVSGAKMPHSRSTSPAMDGQNCCPLQCDFGSPNLVPSLGQFALPHRRFAQNARGSDARVSGETLPSQVAPRRTGRLPKTDSFDRNTQEFPHFLLALSALAARWAPASECGTHLGPVHSVPASDVCC